MSEPIHILSLGAMRSALEALDESARRWKSMADFVAGGGDYGRACKDCAVSVLEITEAALLDARRGGGDQQRSALLMDGARDQLEWLEKNCCTLACVDLPVGEDDAEVGWHVIQHHMAKPHERVIGRGDTPSKAIRDAMAQGGSEA